MKNFDDFLDEQVAWRRGELSHLKTALKSAENKFPEGHKTITLRYSIKDRALIRSSIILAYSHWEGYTKTTFDRMAKLLTKKGINIANLNDSLARYYHLHLLKRIGSDDKAKHEILAICRGESAKGRFPENDFVNTRSNLRYEYFCEILENFGMEFIPHSLKSPDNPSLSIDKFIDNRLCDIRNNIAHGQSSDSLTLKTAIQCIDQVLHLIQELKMAQSNYMANKEYLAKL